jgi:hypothetical protein
MLPIGIQYQCHTVIPAQLGSEFGVLGHLWSQNDIIMSWLRLSATSNCYFASIIDIYKVFECIDVMSIGRKQQPYTVISLLVRVDIGSLIPEP